jgi:hypothetical protein
MPDLWDARSDTEKNEAVAETVMGFRLHLMSGGVQMWRLSAGNIGPLPDYLHDPCLVFGECGVVAKMNERGWSLSVAQDWTKKGDWQVGFLHETEDEGEANEDIFLEAVCHAAYEAAHSSASKAKS